MNASTAKHAKWYVRILDPKIISYKFRAKEKEVNATKFQCILVSKDPSEYMLGLVAFEFKDIQGAKKAFEKFKKGTVWEITTPSFDSKSKSEYNGCPIKTVLLLSPPTKTRPIPPTNKAELDHPAQGLKVALEIKGVMALISTRAFKASGSAKVPTKTFDFIGKITALSSQRSAVAGGQNHRVADATFVDTQGGQITVSIWNEAYDCLQSIPLNSGVVILGCSATKDGSDVKLNIWPSAHISTDGEQAQLLADLDTTNMETEVLTATFTPGQSLVTLAEGEAHPTCCKALADAVGQPGAKVFQINRALLDPPLQGELIHTQDGRFFIKSCRARDRTGSVDVDITSDAVPVLYDCANEAELEQHLTAQTLSGSKCRMNIRGVMREENGITKRYIVKAEKTPLSAVVSMQAMKQCLGLSTISEDVVMPCGADRLLSDHLAGLALKVDDASEPLSAFRVFLLVKGTEKTVMDSLDEKNTAFKVISKNVSCLLSETPTTLQLRAYCDINNLLDYKLDRETALVLVSAVEHDMPGSASSGAETQRGLIATVEDMQKIGESELETLKLSMNMEWKSVLISANETESSSTPKRVHSADSEYWTQSARKLSRLASEPTWPVETASTVPVGA